MTHTWSELANRMRTELSQNFVESDMEFHDQNIQRRICWLCHGEDRNSSLLFNFYNTAYVVIYSIIIIDA